MWFDFIFELRFFLSFVTYRMGHNSLTDWIECLANAKYTELWAVVAATGKILLTMYGERCEWNWCQCTHTTYGENGWASDWEEGKHVTRSLPFTDALRWFDYCSYSCAQMSYNCSDYGWPLVCRLSAFLQYNSMIYFILAAENESAAVKRKKNGRNDGKVFVHRVAKLANNVAQTVPPCSK